MRPKKIIAIVLCVAVVAAVGIGLASYKHWALNVVSFVASHMWERVPNAAKAHRKDCERVADFAAQQRDALAAAGFNFVYVWRLENGTIELSHPMWDSDPLALQVSNDVQKSLLVIYDSFWEADRTFTMIRVHSDRIELTDYNEYPGTIKLIRTDDGKRPQYYGYPGDDREFRTKKLRGNWYVMSGDFPMRF